VGGVETPHPTPPEQVACVLTGRGLKDPETAIANNDGMVIQCPAELAAIEDAVLGDP
jgi:threonine synthase